MSMKKIGESLRQERIRQGLSIGDVNRKIKLSREILEAMEEGRMEELPQPVYVRGFIRSYAAMLNMETSKLGADPSDICPEADAGTSVKECLQQPAGAVVSISGERKQNNLAAVLILMAVLAAIAVMAWYAVSSNGPGPDTPVAESQDTGDTGQDADQAGDSQEETAVAASTQESDPTQLEDDGQEEGQPASDPAEQEVADAAEGDAALAGEDGEPLAQEGVDQAFTQYAEGGPYRLVVQADEDCWMGYTVDGEGPRESTLFAGDIQTFEFTENLTIKLGNPGGVRLTYNGAPYEFAFQAERPTTLALPLE